MNLPQAQAQSLVDYHLAQIKAAQDASTEAYNAMRADWQAKSKADPEVGPKMPQIKETVGRALDTIGDPKLVADFRQAMDLTGLGDNPAVIKVINRLATAVVEGRPVSGNAPSPHGQTSSGRTERPTAAAALYPNNP